MRKLIVIFAILLACATGYSQRPGADEQHLLIMQEGPALNYQAAANNGLTFPAGVTMGLPGDLEFDSRGHLWVVSRPGNGINTNTVVEFDENGKYLRSFGEGLFGNRPHGIYRDADGNIWISDGSSHTVVKLSDKGEVLLTLGTKGQAGNWDEAAGTRLLNQPNDVAIGRNGDIFLAQGHTPTAMGDPRILKFDKTGKFVKSWGGRGTEPGKFRVAHGISIDAKGLVWVTDRENSRIQIFDQDGTFQRQIKYAGLPCSLLIRKDGITMVNGFTGQILELDLEGKVLGVYGKMGEFGEAHNVSVSPKGEIFVGDVTKGILKFVKK
jgi:DNA-binding beta-propeller fold protein YncE